MTLRKTDFYKFIYRILAHKDKTVSMILKPNGEINVLIYTDTEDEEIK